MEAVRLGLILTFAASVLSTPLSAQDCPAVARIPATGVVTGTLGAGSCLLNDGSSYTAFRLDIPVRGRIAIDLSGTSADLQLILRADSGERLDSGAAIRRSIEAGSYRVLVNGSTAGVQGDFKITTSFTAEPSLLCAGFPNLGLRQTVNGSLGNAGCTAPDGTPYDGYALTTFGAGTLTVIATSQDFSPVLVLRGSNGRALATSVGGPLVAPVSADSQYVVIVASADQAGTYQLTTSFQNATDDTCRATRTFAESDNGTITVDSCYQTLAGSGDQVYYNYYNLTLGTGGVVSVQAASGNFVPTIYLLDEGGNTLAVDSVGGGYDASGNARSWLRTPLPAGNYVLQVFSDVASGGSYQFQYTFQTDPLPPCPVTPVTPGDTVNGAISTASCRTGYGLSDLYSVTLASPGTLELDLGSLNFPAVLAIRDRKDNLIVRSQALDGVTAAHITADLPAGVYTVAVSAQSYAGSYRLTSKFSAHEIPPCSYTQAIDLNGGYIQRLTAGSCKGANGQPVDYYGFTLSTDSLVLGVVTSREVDGHLTLLDSSGIPLRTDDNSYGGIDPLIVQYVPAGSYKLAVRDASAHTGGLYEVDLRTVAGPRPPFCAVAGTLSPGGSSSGNITYTGCQYADRTFADLYQITIEADTTLDLQLNSSEFDAFLVLLDAKGNVMDDDDDNGGNTNARITAALPAGTYYVVAKPVGNYLSHGAYSLSAKLADSVAAK